MDEAQKQQAIDTHTSQASEFDDSYKELGRDAYKTCFTYSRRRLEVLLEHYLPAHGAGHSHVAAPRTREPGGDDW